MFRTLWGGEEPLLVVDSDCLTGHCDTPGCGCGHHGGANCVLRCAMHPGWMPGQLETYARDAWESQIVLAEHGADGRPRIPIVPVRCFCATGCARSLV